MTRICSAAPLGAAALTIGLLLGACSSPQPTSAPAPAETESSASPSGSAAPTPGDGTFLKAADVDRADADATGEATALLLASWDTTTDRTQTAGALRAKSLMAPSWAAQQVEPDRNGNQGEWLVPSQHRAYSAPAVVPADGDVTRNVSPSRAVRAYTLTWRWIPRDGTDEIRSQSRLNATIYLEKVAGRWSVVGHQLTDMGQ